MNNGTMLKKLKHAIIRDSSRSLLEEATVHKLFEYEFNYISFPIRLMALAMTILSIGMSPSMTRRSILKFLAFIIPAYVVYAIFFLGKKMQHRTYPTNIHSNLAFEFAKQLYSSITIAICYHITGSKPPVYLFSVCYLIPNIMTIELLSCRHLYAILITGSNILSTLGTMYFVSATPYEIMVVLALLLTIQWNTLLICIYMKRITSFERNFEGQRFLIRSRELYKKLYKNAPCLFITMDNCGYITNCNLAVLELTGLKKEDIIGKKIHSLFSKESYSQIDSLFEKANNGNLSNFEVNMIAADGSTHTMLGSLARTYDPRYSNAAISMINIILQDITLKKRLSNELELAKRKAEQASEAKTAFLGMTSHEMKTPLTSIIAQIELLMKEKLTEEQQFMIRSLKTSSELLLVLINDILDIQKIENGKFELDYVEFNLEQSLQTLEQVTGTLAKSKKLDYRIINRVKGCKNLFGDFSRLNQVLINLVNNAIKFTSKGSVEILVTEDIDDLNEKIRPKVLECEKGSTIGRNKIRLYFQVMDTGIGIPKDRFNDLFKPFSRIISKNENQRIGGTGLGLSISKNIVELMGGQFFVDSQVGVGSIFCFAVVLEVLHFSRQEMKRRNSACIMPSSRVLVVEDNIINQRILEKMLVYLGVSSENIYKANNGIEAIDIVQRCANNNGGSSLTAIFMDVEMPIMNGIEATREIRKIDKNVPIIMLTANSNGKIKEEALQAGCTDFISKPFTLNVLSQFIKKSYNFTDGIIVRKPLQSGA
jgi:PAS domain S-box-containing protein